MAKTRGTQGWTTPWLATSCLTYVALMLIGTEPVFAAFTLLIFLLTPVTFRAYQNLGNIGGYIFLATFAKLLIVSQWVKIALLQPADSHLMAPTETAFVLLLGLLSFLIAAWLLKPVVGVRGGLVDIPQSPRFLLYLAGMATALAAVAVVARHMIGLDRVGDAIYQEGRGYVVVMFLDQMLPLAVAALTARAAILSNGRRFIDALVVLALLATFAQGVWDNVRTLMMGGAVAFVLTYLSYGGRIRVVHLVAVVCTGIAMQVIVFPLIDLQRGIARGTTTDNFMAESLNIASDLFDSKARDQLTTRLDDLYMHWDTRLYYGNPLGFLDRFSPNSLDETVAFTDSGEPFGVGDFMRQFTYSVPNVLLRTMDIERPKRGGEVLETSILGTFSNMNYGVFAEIYAYFGLAWFLPAMTMVILLYCAGLHIVYGNIRKNYFMAFGFSTLYFTFASSDLADIIPQVTLQGTLNLLILVVASALTGRIGVGARRAGAAVP